MPKLYLTVAAVLTACVSGIARAEQDTEKLRKIGEELLDRLPKIDPSFQRTVHFEIAMGPKPVGWVVSTTGVARSGGKAYYEYTSEMTLGAPNGTKMVGKVTALLDRYLCPRKTVLNRTVISPDGQKTQTVDEAVTGAKQIVLKRTVNGKSTKREVPRPRGRFVFDVEALHMLLPLEAGQRFILSDFDPQKGTLTDRTYSVTRTPAGNLRVDTAKQGPTGEFAFYVLDAKRQIVESGMGFGSGRPAPSFKAVTKQRWAEVKRAVGD